MLSSPLWKKRLVVENRVVARMERGLKKAVCLAETVEA